MLCWRVVANTNVHRTMRQCLINKSKLFTLSEIVDAHKMTSHHSDRSVTHLTWKTMNGQKHLAYYKFELTLWRNRLYIDLTRPQTTWPLWIGAYVWHSGPAFSMVAMRMLKRSIRWDPYRIPPSILHNLFSIQFWKYSTLLSSYFAISSILLVCFVLRCIFSFIVPLQSLRSQSIERLFFHFHLYCSLIVYSIFRSLSPAPPALQLLVSTHLQNAHCPSLWYCRPRRPSDIQRNANLSDIFFINRHFVFEIWILCCHSQFVFSLSLSLSLCSVFRLHRWVSSIHSILDVWLISGAPDFFSIVFLTDEELLCRPSPAFLTSIAIGTWTFQNGRIEKSIALHMKSESTENTICDVQEWNTRTEPCSKRMKAD